MKYCKAYYISSYPISFTIQIVEYCFDAILRSINSTAIKATGYIFKNASYREVRTYACVTF